MRHRRRNVIAIAVLLPTLLVLTACTRFGATISRPSDPVVLDGAALPKLIGSDPMRVVGFAWDGSTWHQIPVQVDERDLVNPGQIYHRPTNIWPTLSGTQTPYMAPRRTRNCGNRPMDESHAMPLATATSEVIQSGLMHVSAMAPVARTPNAEPMRLVFARLSPSAMVTVAAHDGQSRFPPLS